jgi:hypothetical protein
MGIVPIILLAVVVIGFLAWKSHQRTVETWRRVGAELGLNTTVGKGLSRPVLSGAIAGLPVKVDTYTQRSGNNSTTYTRYRVGYPPLGIGLQLKREGLFSSVTKLFGFQDVAVGDAAFDDNFNVKTNDEAKLRNLLTPSVRSGLLQFMASYPQGAIKDAHIEVTTSRFESKADRLRSTVQRMVATARLLASPTAGVTDDMVTDREQGLVDEVAGRVRDLVEAEPDDVDQRIFEVETLAAAGQDDAAAERLRELERLAPADPDVVGWRQTLESTSSAASSPDEAVDVNELAQNLFGGSDLSFETRSKFNQRYADSSIRWQGRVKSVSEMGEGWQAVITVAIVSNDLYGNTDIDVVVENPAGPRPSEGQTVVISGKLTRIDPLMRNLFITEGSLS